MIQIKQLPDSDIERIAEIDRSEHVTLSYVYRDGKLKTETVDWHVPRWPLDGPGDFSVKVKIAAWGPILQEGGMMLGALDGDRLVGVAILRPRLTERMAQLAVLHVSNAYRRQGIATRLTQQAIRLAEQAGAKDMYVSATPSQSAVGFYQSQGFKLVKKVHPELYALEPDDIHMIKEI